MKIAKYASVLCAAAVIALICGGNWIAAKGPAVASFPGFISFDINKTGDVAIDKVGNVYINFTDKDGFVKIRKFTPAGEDPVVIANLGKGTAFGLAVRPEGDLYAINNGAADKGIYRVDRDGSTVRLPGTEQIVWANGLAFDQRGNLYVTETYSGSPPAFEGQGGIWRIPPQGDAEPWLHDDLLTGIGKVIGPVPVGANGIAFYHGDLYVVNTDKGTIVRIHVRPDGSPGEPEVWATLQEVPESLLAGFPFPAAGDGLALDVHGNVYVTVVTRAAVVKINAEDSSQETIATFLLDENAPLFAPLDAPNTIGFGTGKGGRQDLFVTNAGGMAAIVPGPSWPGRGLVKIEAGEPGQPLP